MVESRLTANEFAQEANSAREIGKMVLDKYRIGMNGDALIELESKQSVLTIPLIATRVIDDSYLVDVKNGEGEIEERFIEVGLETNEPKSF